MLISETFLSLQGEGVLAGMPSFFIRTSGCNLRCRWCDTPTTSWAVEGQRHSVSELLDQVETAAVDHVVVTGGEPLLQREIGALTRGIENLGKHITVETAGTVAPDFVCDLLSLSPKMVNSDPSGPWRQRHQRWRSNLDPMHDLLGRGYEVQLKFVVVDEDDVPPIVEMVTKLGIEQPSQVVLMPEGRTAEEVAAKAPLVASLCVEYGFRYTPRLHLDLFGGRRGT